MATFPQTGICRYFASTGQCFYGDHCNFSHIAPFPGASAAGGVGGPAMSPPASAAGGPRSQRLCRNIQLYGFCKFAGRGCEYNHDVSAAVPFDEQQELYRQAAQAPAAVAAPRSPVRGGGVSPGPQPTRSPPPAVIMPPQPQPHAAHFRGRRPLHSFFVSESLRAEFARQDAEEHEVPPPEDPRVKGLPASVGRYHSLCRLDALPLPRDRPMIPTYKCFSATDGETYVLRQMEGVHAITELGRQMAELWQQAQHPNVVALREVFVSGEVGETPSLFFAYDFVPGAETLHDRFLRGNQRWPDDDAATEQLLWSVACQLSSALAFIHGRRLTCRSLVPTKVLVSPANRFKLVGCGMADVLSSQEQDPRPDWVSLGAVLFALAQRAPISSPPPAVAVDSLRKLSPELRALIAHLLSGEVSNVSGISAMLAPHLLEEASALYACFDASQAELRRELENGRLFRLASKLSAVLDRPEHACDPAWTGEAGERQPLRMLRSYIFHQVASRETGAPSADLAFAVDALNKLDAGSAERVLLTSRDEQVALIVSWAELKRCLDDAFAQLMHPKFSPHR